MHRLRKLLLAVLSFAVLFVASIAGDAEGRPAKAVATAGAQQPGRPEQLPPDKAVALLLNNKMTYREIAGRLAIEAPHRMFAESARPELAGHWETSLASDQAVNVSVVMLADRERNDWQDLVFIQNADRRWTFAGVWNMPKQAGKRPSHRVVTIGPGRTVLAVRYKGDPGEDCKDVQQESWLEPGAGNLHETLRFPAAASGCTQTLVSGYSSRYRVTDYRQWSVEKTERLELRYAVENADGSSSQAAPIYSHMAFVRYFWLPTNRTFVVDPENSDTDNGMMNRFRLVLDPDKLIRQHTNDFLKLARTGSPRQQAWLLALLQLTQEGSLKSRILDAWDNPSG